QRSDPERVLAAGDLLVHLPLIEAFGLAVVQAMATALPVVATAVGGLPEVVVSGVTGQLVEAEALPSEVGASIAAAVADPGHRAELGAAGLQRARDHFSMQLAAERHRALY